MLQIHWLPIFEDFHGAGFTTWDVVSAIDASANGGLPARTPAFWEWVLRVLQEEMFPSAPNIPDDLRAWRYAPTASKYFAPAWKAVTTYKAATGVEGEVLEDRWHDYLMHERCVYGTTYDEILVRHFGEHRSNTGFAAEGVELTDEFLDWAM